MFDTKKQLEKINKSPGVYIFCDQKNKIIYIGKAKNLRARVKSYFMACRDNRPLVPKIVAEVKKIKTIETSSEVEAILLEARLIKKFKPIYNIKQKDDKSFIYVLINYSDQVPCVKLIRQNEILEGQIMQKRRDKLFGPFISAIEIKKLLVYFRSVIPFRDCADAKYKKYNKIGRGCQWAEIGKCSAPCNSKDVIGYRKNISKLSRLFSGKINSVKKDLVKEMNTASKNEDYEEAAEIRDRIKTLEHIKEVSLLENKSLGRKLNIEAIDISNISGKWATGSLVSAKIKDQNVKFEKSGYRKFRIRTKNKPDDVAMIREIVKRRFRHREWNFPDILIIDGGKGQINAAHNELSKLNIKISIISIAKGPDRKGEALHFNATFDPKLKKTLINNKRVIKLLRDEAHRFAVSYHKLLRRKGTIGE